MQGRLLYLTISMVLLLALHPFLEGGPLRLVILTILVSAICLFGIYAVSHVRKNLIIGSVIGIPWFVLTWVNIFTQAPSLIQFSAANLMQIGFYSFTAVVIFSFVLKSTRISGDVLYGAISIYLLIGGIFSTAYLQIETLLPGAFFIDPAFNANSVLDWADFLYFSYTTLTTLGYGDIVPVASVARSFAVFEAILGVMYLAVIISRLVGMYIVQSTE